MLKFIFNFVTEQFTLFDNYLYNYIAMGIIGVIAFVIAFRIVGRLYDDGMIWGSGMGSFLHWTIRLIVCTVLFLAVSFVIWLVKAILSIPIHVWLIIAVVLALSFIAFKVLRIKMSRKRVSINKG